jgi:hypothetical protein
MSTVYVLAFAIERVLELRAGGADMLAVDGRERRERMDE